ncbi:MAG: hypothetical protein ACXU82_03595 [Caulobacteraceae bacterium]
MLPNVLHKLQAAAVAAATKDRAPLSQRPAGPPSASTALQPPAPRQAAA